MPPERKPEDETLVRIRIGQTEQVEGLVIEAARVTKRDIWLRVRRPSGPPKVAGPIDKLSTPG